MLEEGTYDVAIDALHPSDDNPRTISDADFEHLQRLIETDPEFMEARPVIAVPDGEIVAGHMRWSASKELGRETVRCYVKDLSPQKKREWKVRDNTNLGDWVPDELAALVAAQRDDDGSDLEALGLRERETTKLLAAHDDVPVDPDAGSNGGGGGGGEEAEVWGVIVECDTEEAQVELLDRLAEEGFEVRALIP